MQDAINSLMRIAMQLYLDVDETEINFVVQRIYTMASDLIGEVE